MKIPPLPSGTTGFYNDQNVWVCTGSRMGRRNSIPDHMGSKFKLRLYRLPFVGGCYDRWGAYFGAPANVWIATNRVDVQGRYRADGAGGLIEVFERANSREEAKRKVKTLLPGATFYR